MSALDDALVALELAVARLEAAAAGDDPAVERERTAEAAREISKRVDAALVRLDKLLAEGG